MVERPGRPRYRDATRHDRVATAPSPTIPAFRVAIDVGPLYGHRTGVGVATAGLLDALATRDDVDARPVRGELPLEGRRPAIAGCRCRASSPRTSWARSDWPRVRPLGGRRARRSTAPTTSCRRRRLPAVVSVYDCWFLRHPESRRRRSCGAPASACAGRSTAGAFVHASSDDTARRGSRSCSAPTGSTTIPLGLPPAPPPLADLAPRRRRGRRSPAIRSCWRSAPRSDARTCRCSSTRSGRSPPSTPSCGSCWPGRRATTARPSSRRSRRARRTAPAIACCARCRRRRHQALAAAARSRARLPVARRGFRLPDPRGAAGGDAGGRQRRRADPEIAGDGVLLVGGRDPAASRRRSAGRSPTAACGSG